MAECSSGGGEEMESGIAADQLTLESLLADNDGKEGETSQAGASLLGDILEMEGSEEFKEELPVC